MTSIKALLGFRGFRLNVEDADQVFLFIVTENLLWHTHCCLDRYPELVGLFNHAQHRLLSPGPIALFSG
jgi:hypothetical protein